MRRLWWVGVCLCLASCSKDPHPLYPAKGRLVVNGQPAAGVRVVFHHVEDWGEKSIVPQGWTDSEGRFELQTYRVKDGAPPGEYRVLLWWPSYRIGKNVSKHDRFREKYSDPKTTELKANLAEGPNEVPTIEIKMDDLLPENYGLEPAATGRPKDR
jgi:hypothetical protein